MTLPALSPENDQLAIDTRPAIGTLDEYSTASLAFFSDAVGAIVRAGDGVLSEIGVEQMEAIPQMQHTLSSGEVLQSPPLEASSQISFSRTGVIEGELGDFHLAVYQTAERMEDAMTRHMFQHISEVTEATGNVVRANGGSMWEASLEMLETIHLSFDQDGVPTLPTLVVNPETHKKMGDPPPDFVKRLNEIVLRRRDEWLARRRTRRLPRPGH